MSDNIVEFHSRPVKPRTRTTFIDQPDEEEDWTPRRRNPNMHTFRFRGLKLILESDETDLVRDVRFDFDKAKTKLKKIRQRLKSVQEQAAAQVRQLTAAETKLNEAIEEVIPSG
jgi:hypothetical protein